MKAFYDEKKFGQLKKYWLWVVVFGVLFTLAGVVGLGMPLVATVTSVTIFAFFLFAAGVFQIIQAFQSGKSNAFWYTFLFGILYLVVGVIIAAKPVDAAVWFTLLIGWLFVFFGFARCFFAFQVRPVSGWGFILFSGIMSLLLGILFITDWPGSGFWTIGMLVSIELLFAGISLIALGMTFKNL